METFKTGDKVYHIEYGWGEVKPSLEAYGPYPVRVDFDKFVVYFTKEGKEDVKAAEPMLSFTKYTFTNFSQERPIELPQGGEICLASICGVKWELEHFAYREKEYNTHPYVMGNGSRWRYIKRIKLLD
jgi:hypothetical protein